MGVVQIKWGICLVFPGLAMLPPSFQPVKRVTRFRPFKFFSPGAADFEYCSLRSLCLLYMNFLTLCLECVCVFFFNERVIQGHVAQASLKLDVYRGIVVKLGPVVFTLPP